MTSSCWQGRASEPRASGPQGTSVQHTLSITLLLWYNWNSIIWSCDYHAIYIARCYWILEMSRVRLHAPTSLPARKDLWRGPLGRARKELPLMIWSSAPWPFIRSSDPIAPFKGGEIHASYCCALWLLVVESRPQHILFETPAKES